MDRKNKDWMYTAKVIGSNLKYLRSRSAKFIPLKVPAGAIGVTQQQMSKYELGVNIPCAHRLIGLANHYGVKIDDLCNPSFIHVEQRKFYNGQGYEQGN